MIQNLTFNPFNILKDNVVTKTQQVLGFIYISMLVV